MFLVQSSLGQEEEEKKWWIMDRWKTLHKLLLTLSILRIIHINSLKIISISKNVER